MWYTKGTGSPMTSKIDTWHGVTNPRSPSGFPNSLQPLASQYREPPKKIGDMSLKKDAEEVQHLTHVLAWIFEVFLEDVQLPRAPHGPPPVAKRPCRPGRGGRTYRLRFDPEWFRPRSTSCGFESPNTCRSSSTPQKTPSVMCCCKL